MNGLYFLLRCVMLCETTISKECWIERRTVRYDRVNCELVIGPGLLQLAGRGGENNWAIFNLPFDCT